MHAGATMHARVRFLLGENRDGLGKAMPVARAVAALLVLVAGAACNDKPTNDQNDAAPGQCPECSLSATVIVADRVSGDTLGDKISTALATLAMKPGEVWVFGEGKISSMIEVGPSQRLRFFAGTREIEGGSFQLSGRSSILSGAGAENTIFVVHSTTGKGVIELTSGEPAGTVEDLQLAFDQPDSADRGALIHYPPAIYASAQPRFRVRRLKIVRAWDGINMTGNSGGALIEDLQMSAFGVGIDINGALDTVRVNDYHFWPFGLTSNQNKVFAQPGGGTMALRSARMDDLRLSGFFNISALGIQLNAAADGHGTFGLATNVSFDTMQGLEVNAGGLELSGCAFTSAGQPWLVQRAGHMDLSGCQFFGAGGIEYSGGVLNISGSHFNTGAVDKRSVTSSGSALMLTGNFFERTPGVAYTAPAIDVTAGRATIVSNRISDKGGGAGTFIRIADDDWHRVAFNAPVGWAITTPAANLGVYSPN